MTPQTFIFFGPSGCGKGTQAKLLQEELAKKDPTRKILYIETGQKLRELAEKDTYTGKETKKILENGRLVPVFLPIWIWTEILMENITGDEHIFMDGISRRIEEANVLDSALQFYKRENPIVVSIEVSDKWATERLLGRGRSDDTEEEIKNRLSFYHKDVVPVLEYFKNNSYYKFISINGERSIEEVHQDLVGKIFG
ncbi:MAG: nucleoside monophosphate kinase [Patescibacteria group bacterium]